MARIAIDAGHGGSDPGAVFNGRQEKDDNLDIALAVGEILSNNGQEVIYTRTDDVYDSPVRKAQIANEQNADYFVSIHRNSSPTPNMYSGVQTLIYDNNGIKRELAENINSGLEQAGYNNLGISLRQNLAVLRRTQMPAVLIEVGFINNDTDNRILDNNFEAIAEGIANGILNTLGYGNNMGGNTSGSNSSGNYYIQVGLFRNRENAQMQYNNLSALGIPARILNSGSYYAVQAGPETEFNNAVELERSLRELGYDTLLVTER